MYDNEKQLLDKARKGDADSFEKLIENYQKKAFNIAFRMVGNYDDANDVVQEALIKVYKSLKSFKEQSLFSTWLYRVVMNVCLDELRKRKRRKTVYIDEEIRLDDSDVKREIESDDPTPEETMERNEVKEVVEKAINKLSDEHRLVIVLRDIQGFSYEEISHIAGCPEGTVKSRISRARQALKDILLTKKELLSIEYVNKNRKEG